MNSQLKRFYGKILIASFMFFEYLYLNQSILNFICRQYTLHKSFCGAKINTNNLDLWEESLDGSGKKSFIIKNNLILSLTHVKKGCV